jgi:Neutral/alkaline non-lysosomal ceramidase.
MKAAAASIDITPPVGLPIGGNVRDDNKSRGIHDKLFCNAIVFESNDERICLLSFDLSALYYDLCRHVKSEIFRETGITPEKIVVLATHTHSGPDLTEGFGEGINEGCIQYFHDITRKIVREIMQLIENLVEVDIRIGKNLVYDLSFNRRLVMKDGPMRMNWEDIAVDSVEREAGPIDPELFVISISTPEGKVKALMINFTLHPAVLVGKDWLWSRDYINYLDGYLKNKLGNDTVVFFSNGAEGNVNHINFRDKNQDRGFTEAKRIGEALGRHVHESLENAEGIECHSLKCKSRTIELPLRAITDEQVEWANGIIREYGDVIPSLLDGVPDEVYAREIIKLTAHKEKSVKTEIQAVALGDTAILTLPGEVFVEYGLMLKESSGFKNTLLFGLANDYLGYIPTEAAFDEGGYEIKTASSSKLDTKAGDILVAEILKMIKSLD